MVKKVLPISFCTIMVILVLWVSGEGFAATLTVTKGGDGNGTVTSSPTGIKCGADCTEAYLQGKKVTLKAKADSDSTFTGWTGGVCSGTGSCTVIMNSDFTVNSTFTAKTVDFGVSLDEIDFGELEFGSKVSRTLIITNTGTADIQVEISGLDETEFSISGKNIVSIKPQKSYKLKVTFKPTDTGPDEALQHGDPVAVGLEDTEDPDSEGGVKIIDVQGQMNLKASNKSQSQSKSRIVTLKGGKKVQAKEYEIDVNNELQFKQGGIEFTYKEDGRIPFELVQNHVHCYDSTGQIEISCMGATKHTVTGKVTGANGVCTWDGTGFVTYEIGGGVANGTFNANINVIDFQSTVQQCCQTAQGTVCSGVPGWDSSFLSWYINGRFEPEIPFKAGGNVHLTPDDVPGFVKVSLWWKLIFP